LVLKKLKRIWEKYDQWLTLLVGMALGAALLYGLLKFAIWAEPVLRLIRR